MEQDVEESNLFKCVKDICPGPFTRPGGPAHRAESDRLVGPLKVFFLLKQDVLWSHGLVECPKCFL